MFWRRQDALDCCENQRTALEESDLNMKLVNCAQQDIATTKKPSQIAKIFAWMTESTKICFPQMQESISLDITKDALNSSLAIQGSE